MCVRASRCDSIRIHKSKQTYNVPVVCVCVCASHVYSCVHGAALRGRRRRQRRWVHLKFVNNAHNLAENKTTSRRPGRRGLSGWVGRSVRRSIVDNDDDNADNSIGPGRELGIQQSARLLLLCYTTSGVRMDSEPSRWSHGYFAVGACARKRSQCREDVCTRNTHAVRSY